MNAKDLKPWIFWIVCGVLAVAIVVAALAVEPTNAKGKPAAVLKKEADSQLGALAELKRRAGNNPYARTFDPERTEDISSLTSDHVVPPSWERVLRPHVEGYDVQTAQIKSHLAERSAWLHSQISTSTDNFDWYKEYERQTADLLRRLGEAGCLVLPAQANLAEDAALRSGIGLFTKSGEFVRDQTQRQGLSRTYRHIEHVAGRIMEARGRIVENPVVQAVAGDVPQSTVPARIIQIDVAETDEPLGGQMAGLGTGRRVTVRLEGAVAALQAAVARLESNERVDRPITVVAGVNLTRRPPAGPGANRDRPAEDLAMEIRLAILDFSQLAQPAQPVNAQEASP
ncbi:MAG: hypothetical protein RLZZ127_3326 [Planctomycetota bacterium]